MFFRCPFLFSLFQMFSVPPPPRSKNTRQFFYFVALVSYRVTSAIPFPKRKKKRKGKCDYILFSSPLGLAPNSLTIPHDYCQLKLCFFFGYPPTIDNNSHIWKPQVKNYLSCKTFVLYNGSSWWNLFILFLFSGYIWHRTTAALLPFFFFFNTRHNVCVVSSSFFFFWMRNSCATRFSSVYISGRRRLVSKTGV